MSPDMPSILIVDDDPVTCDLLCEVFTREGFTTRFAQSGEAALTEINVINIHLPPLRERRDDIPLLVAHFLRKHALEGETQPVLDERALHCLVSYSWPGNVRELENIIERAITLNRTGQITPVDFPAKVCGSDTVSVAAKSGADDLAALFAGLPTIDEMERRYLLYVLEATGGNRKRAAEILGINRRTLYRMAERFQIEL
jgi:two-component system, NtrC family, response regulator AtoC